MSLQDFVDPIKDLGVHPRAWGRLQRGFKGGFGEASWEAVALTLGRVGVVGWVAAEGVEGGEYAGKILRRDHHRPWR